MQMDSVNIIDTQTYQRLMDNDRACDELFYGALDLDEELGLSEDIKEIERGIKLEIVSFSKHPGLLIQYRSCINDYYNFSNFNKIRGVADLSIIALVGYVLEQPKEFLKLDINQLEFNVPGLSMRSHNRAVEVFTLDRSLSRRLKRRFSQSVQSDRLFVGGYKDIEKRSYYAPPRHKNQRSIEF